MKMTFETVTEVYEANDSIRARLIETVAGLNEEESNFLSENGKWTIREIVEHLLIVESAMTRVMARLLENAEAAGKTSDGSAGLSEGFLQNISDVEQRKFEAPDRVSPTGTKSITESLSLLRASRDQVNLLRDRFETVDGSELTFPHPAFGPMTAQDWLAFIGGHEQRHIAQIEKILATNNN